MQLFTMSLGKAAEAADCPVKISYTYRVLVQQNSHVLYVQVRKTSQGDQGRAVVW